MAQDVMNPVRCCGITKNGKRCSLTSTSNLLNDRGISVAEPLRRGGDLCLFHARPFSFQAVEVHDAIIIFIDFETTGLDVARDRIVEIGALSASGVFATVVCPGITSESAVHGIDEAELAEGPTFPIAWGRFVAFAEGLVTIAVHEDSDSDNDDTPCLPQPPETTPAVLLAARNGERFDCAMLLCECYRHGVPWLPLECWYFVDTLWVIRAVEPVGGCMKLQCMFRSAGGTEGLRAHRALDDCHCLRDVLEFAAARMGLSLLQLLQPFAVKLDSMASAAQVSVLVNVPDV